MCWAPGAVPRWRRSGPSGRIIFPTLKGDFMPDQGPKRSKLRVASVGKAHYIEVPTGEAVALHDYLRQNGVLAGHPEPCYSNTDAIALPRGADAAAAQELLDRWA